MKITSAHLDNIKKVVQAAQTSVEACDKAAHAAQDAQKSSQDTLSRNSRAFDLLANAFVNDMEYTDEQCAVLPLEIQTAIGWSAKKSAPPEITGGAVPIKQS